MASLRDSGSESSDDEFPDLRTLLGRGSDVTRKGLRTRTIASQKRSVGSATGEGRGVATAAPAPSATEPSAKAPLRRRKLGPVGDSLLLQPWNEDAAIKGGAASTGFPNIETRKCDGKVKLRTRKPRVATAAEPASDENDATYSTEDVTCDEEISSDDSFRETASQYSTDDDWYEAAPRPPLKQITLVQGTKQPRDRTIRLQHWDGVPHIAMPKALPPSLGLTGLEEQLVASPGRGTGTSHSRAAGKKTLGADESTTPPPTSPRPRPAGLTSPKKMPKIPKTPHRPSADMFWSQEFVDDWNDEHSPRKQLFPDTARCPARPGQKKKEKRADKPVSGREAKRSFEQSKQEVAAAFLRELDLAITSGRLAEMTVSTGGIQLNWTNKLNTTAGRANWKRETIRTKPADGGEATVEYRHRASIDLAEKVIDDENRLLNVIAHEFCHLANFMVSGVTKNPHGKEFKAWAARCSGAFGDRGIEVTTKHSYDIDFKYVWECASCAAEYKRHSKSIHPERHRCGACKGELRQTKPVPRGPAKASAYQQFMKEQMKVLRAENPQSPQKDIMRLVADRWSRHESKGGGPKSGSRKTQAAADDGAAVDKRGVSEVADGLGALSLGETLR